MVNMFLQFFFIGLPFVPGPISRYEFPVLIESLIDTSNATSTLATYGWIGGTEVVQDSRFPTSDFSMSRYFLDESGFVKERRKYSDDSGGNYFTEVYEMQSGRLAKWNGSSESALCFYVSGTLDSVYLVNTDQEDAEIYSYKFAYDSEHRLIQVDRKSIVPNNNPGPDKRSLFQYYHEDSILVKTFSSSEASDTAVKKIVLEKGLPTQILTPAKVNGRDIIRIKRFTYLPPVNAFIVRKSGILSPSISVPFIDVLGRTIPLFRATGSRATAQLYGAPSISKRRPH